MTRRARDRPAVAYGAGYGVGRELAGRHGRLASIRRRLPNADVIPLSGSPSALAFGSGSLWVATEFGQRLVRIDPHSDVVQADDAARQSAGRGRRRRRRRLGRGADRRRRPPWRTSRRHRPHGRHDRSAARCTSVTSSNVATTVYDGLAAVRRVGGSAGDQLVPDLAVALPQAIRWRQDVHVPPPSGNPLFRRPAASARETFGERRSGPSSWTAPRSAGSRGDLVGASRCTDRATSLRPLVAA